MTARVGLVGWPVEHSVSPAMHNAAFAALRLDWEYDLIQVPPSELGKALTALMKQGYQGFNITLPHKLAASELASGHSRTVQATSAANTLVVTSGGTLWADNTDAPGFWADLLAHDVGTPPGEALILGTGGSARAVAYALLNGGWRVHVLSRDDSRAEDFARTFSAYGPTVAMLHRALGERIKGIKLVVNCTPVGMWPPPPYTAPFYPTPWPDGVPFPSDVTLYDLIYNPPRTPLMAQAEEAGAQAIGGLGMLVEQGGLAFELWTGQSPPLDVMRIAAENALRRARRRLGGWTPRWRCDF